MSGPSVAESDELLPPYEGIRLTDVVSPSERIRRLR